MLGKVIIGLGKAIVGLTAPIHEFLFQKGGDTGPVTNPIDDKVDGEQAVPVQNVYWWVGGTSILMLILCVVSGGAFKVGRGKGGNFLQKLKRKFKR